MKKISRISKVSLLLAVLFTVDKLLGVARQMVISRQFGLSAELDVFNAANNLPDMLFMLISGGALAIAFIPVLTEVLSKEGQAKAWDLFSNILNIAFTVTALLAIIIAIFARPLVSSQLGVAPGFTPEQIDLTVSLLRLNLVATLIFSLSGLVMAGLQANQHFLLPALAPIFYDIGQIFGAVVLAPSEPYQIGGLRLPAYGLGVRGLVYGVIIGAALHLLIQVPGLVKYKFKWRPGISFTTPETKKVFRLMGPRLLSMLCIQSIFLIQDNLASRLATGSVTALTYGWWIMQVPETLIGTAIATAILPTLSELFSNNEFDKLREKIERAAQVMLALTIPVAVIAGAVIFPVIQTVFGFDQADSLRVTQVARIFLLGIVGHSLVELFVRSFYSMQKPKFPLVGSVVTLILYLILGITLLPSFKVSGIAAANTIAYSVQAILLLFMLNKQFPAKQVLAPSALRGLLAAVLGGAAAYLVMQYTPGYSSTLISAILGAIVGILLAGIVIRKDLRQLTNL
ncbi:MAG: murein biosynthesis integral membrane protein MurJ [Anaerolineaceae bacterium]